MNPKLAFLQWLLYMAQQIPDNQAAVDKIQALIDELNG